MKIKSVLTIVLVALVGVSGFFYSKRSIQTAVVRKGDIIESVYGLGEVKSQKIYELKPGVTGTILKLHVKEGESVRKGGATCLF